ncbi:hypothetical protein FNV62_32445 [Streptomyces sp. RLB3-17]|nr:hypothetical protein FNV61_33385 [Streptomyces sp. RLB3-6]QDO00432.1 hypothetical protein FNV58_34710 [Streptomyces sp. RLB1-9]QDO10649.1 hypothetical protein FNV68_34555 [Streptomyces sp. S1D4-23]QDO22163.1 hypothetical protein FNV65_33280 [Streptomyces sp. S1A1-8]QDO32288.1 hypothetical protein FNV63_33305 [Streptomyces sp. S1A1-3]QDO42202.1 hypothetical protein FNV62_32445 [Streptomyces sp. RLB3-17]
MARCAWRPAHPVGPRCSIPATSAGRAQAAGHGGNIAAVGVLRTYSHHAGTCRIGTDETAVVDPKLRVRGVSGLRVADASVMPSSVSANTNATVYAIAERAADLVRPPS